jgi:hypothetical protein
MKNQWGLEARKLLVEVTKSGTVKSDDVSVVSVCLLPQNVGLTNSQQKHRPSNIDQQFNILDATSFTSAQQDCPSLASRTTTSILKAISCSSGHIRYRDHWARWVMRLWFWVSCLILVFRNELMMVAFGVKNNVDFKLARQRPPYQLHRRPLPPLPHSMFYKMDFDVKRKLSGCRA